MMRRRRSNERRRGLGEGGGICRADGRGIRIGEDSERRKRNKERRRRMRG